jgi:hypothetical protein
VELITDREEILAMVAAPKEEKEEEAVAFDPNAVEVEKKGKEANPDEELAAEGEAPKAEKSSESKK